MQRIYNNIRPTLDYLKTEAWQLRSAVAALLTRGIPYRQAEQITGVSKTTLHRKDRILGPANTEEDGAIEFEFLEDEPDQVQCIHSSPNQSNFVAA